MTTNSTKTPAQYVAEGNDALEAAFLAYHEAGGTVTRVHIGFLSDNTFNNPLTTPVVDASNLGEEAREERKKDAEGALVQAYKAFMFAGMEKEADKVMDACRETMGNETWAIALSRPD